MPVRVPFRRLATEIEAASKDRAKPGAWRHFGNLIDRNFRRVEDALGHAGVLSGTTDASGFLTVTHGAGFVPVQVLVTPTSPISGGNIFGQVIADSFTSTTFRIRCIGNTGTAFNAVAVTASYLCLR